MVLNHHHTVVPNLDIFAKVGKAAAHDELIPFTIENGQLLVGEDSSDFDGTLNIEFSKVLFEYRTERLIPLLHVVTSVLLWNLFYNNNESFCFISLNI